MIESFDILPPFSENEVPRELSILSLISRAIFQPLSLEDNLLVALTALTSGSGVGFNRAMLLVMDGDRLRGEMWLGPGTAEEAAEIWRSLAASGSGYPEMIEHNRRLIKSDRDTTLTRRMKNLTFHIDRDAPTVPALAVVRKRLILVREPDAEPAMDRKFREMLSRVDEFLCIPLAANDEVMGEIIVDNAITRKQISPADVRLAGLCGLLAGNYMMTDRLYHRLLDAQREAAVGEVAMFLSHQLRNPLTALGGFAEQLLRPGVSEENKQRNLVMIRDEVRRLEFLMDEARRFLKFDRFEPVWFEPWETIQGVLNSPDIAARASGYDLDLTCEKKGGPEIYCDPGAFGEALRNVLDNAFDATPPGGAIHVRAYPNRGGDRFTVSVRDSGKGIADEDSGRIFRPSFTTKENGLGLGLAFVRKVIIACGGTVDFRSRPGKGTVFHLTFQDRLKEPSEGTT